MSKHHKLSLVAAILININIMIGAGVFINTTELAKHAGILGALGYVIIGLLMLPLILSISQLLMIHPTGGFYTFGSKEVHPFIGFLSTWSYFVGKLASATIVTHVSVLFIQEIIPILSTLNPFLLDIIILSTFIVLNMKNVKTSGTIQVIFTLMKMTPIFFIILTGLFLFNSNYTTPAHRIWTGIPSILPLVLFATLGFEAACSISSKIENPQKNAARAVLFSYCIVILIYTCYQFILYGVLGNAFMRFADYRAAFPAFAHNLFPDQQTASITLARFFDIAIASSALSSAYSIIFSNFWNLYILAQHKHTLIPNWLTLLNKNHIPWLCVIAEGIICALYLSITKGDQITLQQTGVLGCVIAYTLSITALLFAKTYRPNISIGWGIPLLGLGNCILLLSLCIYNLMLTGIATLSTFALLILFGISMFWYTSNKEQPPIEA